MLLLDYTAPSPAENLAVDEALLEEAAAGHVDTDLLRLWEPSSNMVVLGRSSRAAQEANVAVCAALKVPILRRASGGCAVLAGPGCLMYSLVLSLARNPHLQAVDIAHAWVLDRIARALAVRLPGVVRQGTSDLALSVRDGIRKFSGNSLRLKRTHLIYHGTVLYDLPLDVVEACLAMPPRTPDYRRGRPHADFVVNLPLSRAEIAEALVDTFDAQPAPLNLPQDRIGRLVAEKYSSDAWNLGR